MNWGTKLVLALGLFMSFIIVLSMKMIFSDKDDLVEKDYYQKGLDYDAEYVKVQSVQRDNAEPVISFGPSRELDIQFKKVAQGTAKFLHSSNRDQDRVFRINADSTGAAELRLSDMAAGYWHLELEWKSDTATYLFKKKVYLQ